MALECNFTDDRSIVWEDAYHRVISVDHIKEPNKVRIHVYIYQNSAARDAGNPWIDSKFYVVKDETLLDTYWGFDVLDGVLNNTYERTYAYLRTLSEYTDAIDA